MSDDFVQVGRSENIPPGSCKLVQAGTHMVAVFRDGENLFACEDLCPHRAGPLSEGKFENGKVTCPWHDATFDLRTGKPLWGPTSKSLKLFKVIEEDGELKVSTHSL